MANIARKTLSAVAVASLLAAGTFVGVGAINGGASFLPSAAAQTAAIDGIPDSANLEINKRLGLPGTARDDGTQIAPEEVPGEPAEGIEFSIFPVNGIDLNTLEGWQAADGLEINDFFPGAAPNSYSTLDRTGLGTETTAVTDADGVAAFTGDTGLYLVVEEANPTLPNGQAVAPAAPFLVTLPMTDPIDRQTWLDTVYVYPKGQAVAVPRKTITDPVPTGDGMDLTGSSLGELIGYEIAADVPALGGDNALNGFSVTDKLPAELGGLNLESVVVTLDGVALAENSYSIRNWSVGAGDDAQEVLLVELTDTGLAQLGAGGGEIVVSFNAPLETTPQANLINQAWVSPTALGVAEGWDPEAEGASPGTPSNATRSIYGQINIQKTGQGDDSDGLADAVFELHRCVDGDLAESSLPIQVGGTTTWTTGADGSASISGIHLANVTDQDDLTSYVDLWEGNGEQFCLVETQAPDGYALLPEPVGVNLVYDADNLELVSVDQPIENVEANAGFSLPLTGGMGIWLILGGGILLLLIAAAYYLVTRKRDNA
ncbi:Fimbrial subunit type 1 precursor [Corynebacterium occultum]|uniref:Fimbrial subunit type 1 n=1 Tax=Corynebacterium occultum TaxID=2675219 RepID=A0A6B8WQ11_9CORY|nr:SpaH/EbpB family LPXTG-anchored major pilin [Corynebacterium occultum]QGU08408.1 Fimbrial subunit type 1 precursor [Corynebacterium occultum]